MIKKLLNLKLKFTKNQKGLTLIELLVVIVILGIIAAIAIPMVSGKVAESKTAAAEQTEAILKDAWERAAIDGKTTGTTPAVTSLSTLVSAGYAQQWDVDKITCTGTAATIACVPK